ncbi:hypothetical protein GCM10027592_60550 [Spirosoma flavus]
MNKQAYIQRVADWARTHGFVEIKANTDGYDKPITYDRQQDGESFTPDVTGKQFDQKSYFEVIMKTDDIDPLMSKLKLLGQLAASRGGQLYLMAPKGNLPFAKSVMADCQITAELVHLL